MVVGDLFGVWIVMDDVVYVECFLWLWLFDFVVFFLEGEVVICVVLVSSGFDVKFDIFINVFLLWFYVVLVFLLVFLFVLLVFLLLVW